MNSKAEVFKWGGEERRQIGFKRKRVKHISRSSAPLLKRKQTSGLTMQLNKIRSEICSFL